MNRTRVRQVLDCASPLALCCVPAPTESGSGLPQSKTLSRGNAARPDSWSQGAIRRSWRLLRNPARLPSCESCVSCPKLCFLCFLLLNRRSRFYRSKQSNQREGTAERIWLLSDSTISVRAKITSEFDAPGFRLLILILLLLLVLLPIVIAHLVTPPDLR
jgi:hypothetical protein